jgi:G3E family GTPase
VLERAGWVRALNDEHDPYMTDPRVSTVRYERLRLFHPSRLAAALDEIDTGRFGLLLRSAGFAGSRPDPAFSPDGIRSARRCGSIRRTPGPRRRSPRRTSR